MTFYRGMGADLLFMQSFLLIDQLPRMGVRAQYDPSRKDNIALVGLDIPFPRDSSAIARLRGDGRDGGPGEELEARVARGESGRHKGSAELGATGRSTP